MTERPNDRAISLSCFICATPRSGSWLLADQILRTGVAGRPEEYFRLDWYERFAATGKVRYRHMKSNRMPERPVIGSTSLSDERGRSFRQFVAGVQQVGTTSNGVFAMKIHWSQLAQILPSFRAHSPHPAASNPELLESWFPNIHYVFLRRDDKIRQAISFHRALQSGKWWSLADEGRSRREFLHWDTGEIDRWVRVLTKQEDEWRAYFRQSSRPMLELSYEDVSRKPRDATAKLLRFIGVDPSAAHQLGPPRLRRQADPATPKAAYNYLVDRRAGLFRRRFANSFDNRGDLMRAELVVVENFFEDPAAVREYALQQPYYHPFGMVQHASGAHRPVWMASHFKRASECPLKSSAKLIDHLEEITGEEIDMEFWQADFPVDADGMPSKDHRLAAWRGSLWNCCFHCKPDTSEELGTGVHNHVDDTWNQVGPHGWSGVVYLNRDGEAPLTGGLKLWRNRDPARNSDWMTPKNEWEMVDSLGNVSNRLILYRGNLPHTGSPGWGQGLHSGRLCLTFYFRTTEPMRRKPLALDL